MRQASGLLVLAPVLRLAAKASPKSREWAAVLPTLRRVALAPPVIGVDSRNREPGDALPDARDLSR